MELVNCLRNFPLRIHRIQHFVLAFFEELVFFVVEDQLQFDDCYWNLENQRYYSNHPLDAGYWRLVNQNYCCPSPQRNAEMYNNMYNTMFRNR